MSWLKRQKFERSLVELAAEGKLEVAFAAAAPPPPGVVWQNEDHQWQATLPAVPSFTVAIGVGMLVVAITMILGGRYQVNSWVMAIGILVGLLGIVSIARPFVTTKRLTVTRDEAVGAIMFLGLGLRRRAIARPRISRIFTTEGLGYAVVIEGHGAAVRIGELPKDTAAWLARFAIAALVDGAPLRRSQARR